MRTTLLALAALSLAACVGPEIQAPVHFAPERRPTDAVLVVRRVAMPERIVVAGPPAYAMLSPSMNGSQLLSAVQAGLAHGLGDVHVGQGVVDERDVGPEGAGPRAFLVRWSVVSYAAALDVPVGEIVGWTVLGSLTAGLGAIPLAGTRVATEHRLTVELALYDVRSARVSAVRLPATGELADEYDTTGLRPLLRREVSVRLRSGVGLGGIGGNAALDFVDAEGHELARRVLAATEDDLAAAIRRAEAAPPPAPPVPAVPAFALPEPPPGPPAYEATLESPTPLT